MLRQKYILIGGLAWALISTSVFADNVTIPNSFSSGTPAVANEVNDNFSAVANAVNDNDSRITSNEAGIGANASAVSANSVKANQNVQDITANTDGISGLDGRVTSLEAIHGSACPGNSTDDIMVKVGPLCVDKYEASIWETLTGDTQVASVDIKDRCSVNGNDCSATDNTGAPNTSKVIYARSKQGVIPASNITWFQAQQACANAGKRLLSNAEWQMAAAGTPDPGFNDNGSTTCAIDGSILSQTGARTACVSNWQTNDMIGNLWEWVADWMQSTNTVDDGSTSTDTYNKDGISGVYEAVPILDQFPAAIMRGGSIGDGLSAGVFALFARSAPSIADNSTDNVGFRCAR